MTSDEIINLDGIPTRCVVSGSGHPVVLIHGGDFRSDSTGDDWTPLRQRLAESGYEVIVPDKLGQGFTGGPEHPSDFQFSRVIDHLHRLLDHMQRGPVTLVGHSRGALAAAAIAVRKPKNTQRLVLVGSNSIAPSHDSANSDFYRKAYAERPDPPTREYLWREPMMNSFDPKHIDEEFIETRYRAAISEEARRVYSTIQQVYDEIFLPDLQAIKLDVLSKIRRSVLKCPTLIVWGRQDRSAPVDLAYGLFDAFPLDSHAVDLSIVDHTAHYPFRERPDLVSAIVSSFLTHT